MWMDETHSRSPCFGLKTPGIGMWTQKVSKSELWGKLDCAVKKDWSLADEALYLDLFPCLFCLLIQMNSQTCRTSPGWIRPRKNDNDGSRLIAPMRRSLRTDKKHGKSSFNQETRNNRWTYCTWLLCILHHSVFLTLELHSCSLHWLAANAFSSKQRKAGLMLLSHVLLYCMLALLVNKWEKTLIFFIGLK